MFDPEHTLRVSNDGNWKFYWLQFGSGRVGITNRVFLLIALHQVSEKWNVWSDSMDGDDDLGLELKKKPLIHFHHAGPGWRDDPALGRIYTPVRYYTWEISIQKEYVIRKTSFVIQTP